MGISILRSLLLAAVVLSNVSWTASRHHFKHNIHGHRSRHRRQDAGLFHPASYVIPGGEGTGAWGEWGKVSPCSRTCGGGVASQKRICLEVGPDEQPLCTGGDTKYFSCQTQDCPESADDFRAEQCAEYDKQAFRGSGITYNWVPYTKAPNPCELNCMPRGERFYYRHKAQVVDGTRCNDESFDVCVEGVCQPVGCDMMLGSNAREDKCRQCRGNGTNCHTVSGLLDTDDLRKGYNDMLLIPQGATNIYIAEVRESNNYLALRAKLDNVYYLNGDYHIDFPRSLFIAGSLWHYERSQQGLAAPDKLRCLGPTDEPLYLSILLQDHNVGIDYEYSVPSSLAPPPNQQYNWVHESFSECSATCGGGFQTRQVTCRSREELNIVDNSLCDEGLRPATNQTCNIETCPPRWVEGPWSPCSKPCGDGGTRSRQVYCEKIITNGFTSMVGDNECIDLLGPKPELNQTCNENASCPSWFTGPWKPCDRLCGEGRQTRQVVCHQRINGFVEIFEDSECEDEKPSTEKSCLLHPCDGVDWVLSDWSGCDTCLSTVRTRVAHCATKDHKVIDSEQCSYHPTPLLVEDCDRTKLPPCQVLWYATQWSNCSVECGKGLQTRRVFCGFFDGASVVKVDDDRCDQEYKYNDTKECVVPQKQCPAKWFAGPWSECTKKCGGGKQNRTVMCLSNGKEVLECDKDTVLELDQSCNIGPCDQDDLLPIDSKSTQIIDDYEDEECEEEDEGYTEVGAEAYEATLSPTLFPDFKFDEGFTETGSGFEETGFTTETYETTDVTGSTQSGETDFTEGSGSGWTETSEMSSTTGTSTDITDSTVTNESETGSEITETTEYSTTGSDDFTSAGTIESSTTESTESIMTDSSVDTSEYSESSTAESVFSTTESESSSTESELSTIGSTDSSTLVSSESSNTETDLVSTTQSTDFSTLVSSESSNTESDLVSTTGSTYSSEITITEQSTTENGESETSSTESSTTENELSTTESEYSTTENELSTAESEPSTTENELSTSKSEPSTTETVSSTRENTDSSTISSSESVQTSTEYSTTENVFSSTTDNFISSTTEITLSSSTENDGSSTTDSSPSSTTDNALSTTTESVATSSTESPESSTTSESASSTTEIEKMSTTENVESSTAESDETSTTEMSTTSTTEISESSTTEITVSSTTDNAMSSTTEIGESSSTESATSSTTESGDISTTEGATPSSTESGEFSSTESVTSSTTESGESSTTESTTPGTTESVDSSSTESATSSTTESGDSSTTGSAETVTKEILLLSTTEYIEISESSESHSTAASWDWKTIVDVYTKKPRCRPRKKIAKCVKSKFGCCPDKRTPATGPFDEGCSKPKKTCKETKFGCCPDGVSPAPEPQGKGCPVAPCNETLYGCCKSDNITAAGGNNQEGCPVPPPACESSEFGCCEDNETNAKGPEKEGCLETETDKPTPTVEEGCGTSEFGCCFDNETDASGPNGEGCPCSITEFGCCPDGLTTAAGVNMEGCVMSCNTSAYGCCPDGETPAHGPDSEGCCAQTAFGCCPDNYKAAEGPHLEGCGCEAAHHGCCPDNVTIARGPNSKGCGCAYSQYGCCPDRHTEAQGPDFEGCGCHTYQFGCCPDGVTIAIGPGLQGCRCDTSKYGCCGDGKTHVKGPNMAGCDCSNSKYGCCPDGTTEAMGEKFLNCTDVPVNRQAACALANDRGTCRNYSVYWFYDMTYGGCSRFWYGGCEGNPNRFVSKEECEDVCVQPSPKDACNLPRVKGVCTGYHVRWYYDSEREQCSQFVFGGCLGNANNFDTKELCQERCEPEKIEDKCNLPIERGPCAGTFARWGFSAERRRCEQFVWGGCAGSDNRFGSEAACRLHCAPPGAPLQACSQPQDVGNCTEKHPAWLFSQSENRCVPFYYTGCGGNDNRFNSERSCAESCPSAYEQELCSLPAVPGECADYTSRWYFDTTKKRCRQFYYGGCGGNENNFYSEMECETRCSDQPATTTVQPQTTPQQAQTTTLEPKRSDFCYLEIDSGPCTDPQTHYAFDSSRGSCVQFQYGGCGGNRNNFYSLEYCQYYCAAREDVCQLPFVSGPCDQSIMQWFYDAASDICSQFSYGGCEGNGNRFNTLEDCERQCRQTPPATTTTSSTTTVAPEYVPAECRVSPPLEECRDSGEVWYLDEEQRTCVSFINEAEGPRCRHTGTFHSQEACERACGAFRGLDVCHYSLDPGPCREAIPKHYFNVATSRCEPFTYGGCHGGPNRFSSVEECTQICRPVTDPCSQSPDSGECLGYFTMWYYDNSRDECGLFVYGGCNGNDNRFETQAECEGQCKKGTTTSIAYTTSSIPLPSPTTTSTTTTRTTSAPSPTPQSMAEAHCSTPESLAPCGENITVYYFDIRTQACLAGDFGGCRYPNSYRTEEECQRRCGAFRGQDVCGSRLDPGPCLNTIPKFYWDPLSGRCLNFAYGGCHGGPNRFSTVKECEEICGATGPEARCLLVVSSGSPGCGVPSRRWYYSASSGDCLAFVYSGCGGNDNNFHTYEECAACKSDFYPIPETETGNEVLPDCDEFNAECAALHCEYGVQRTRARGGCERCSCVAPEVDCASLARECKELKCTYGLQTNIDDDGCERCKCIDHPCSNKECGSGERCVATPYRDAITQEVLYSSDCRIANKSGSCPSEALSLSATEGQCRRQCNDDADCPGVGKCCDRGCSQLCLEPVSPTSPAPRPMSTYVPELPQVPYANEATEPEVRASLGGTVTLRCLFHGNPPPKITWQRGEITIEGDVGRYHLHSDGALEIVSLYHNDSGVYICVADNGLGIARQEVNLQVDDGVEGPAGIAGVSDAVVVGELGQSLSVRCMAYGYPTPSIYWYHGRNGPMVPFSSPQYEARDNVLQIRKLSVDTLGEYICQAYNGIGKPVDWAFTVQAYRIDNEIDSPYLVSRQYEVLITPREPRTEATTTIAPEIEIPVYTVPVATRIVSESTRLSAGSELNLLCEVDGYPVPEVYWTKDSASLASDDRITATETRLTVSRVITNDSGVYGCHAFNAYNSHYSTVQINVEGLYIPASCKDNPYFANCHLIVRSKFCHHKYYSGFCCKSCVESGQLDPRDLELQADSPLYRK